MNLKAWFRNSALMSASNGPMMTVRPDAIEFNGNHPLSKTKPDDMIVANIIDSFARNFEDWKRPPSPIATNRGGRDNNSPVLPEFKSKGLSAASTSSEDKSFQLNLNRVKGRFCSPVVIRGSYRLQTFRTTGDYTYYPWKFEILNFKINEIELDHDGCRRILVEYTKMHNAVTTANAVAAKAKAEMELLESKWNLAEEILGMERTKTGALVYKKAAFDNAATFNDEDELTSNEEDCIECHS